MKGSALWVAGIILMSACASQASQTSQTSPTPQASSATPKSSDPRVGLRAGWMDAAEAVWNLRVVSRTPPSKDFLPAKADDFRFVNSDISFSRNFAIQGNFSGVQVWDISNPAKPTIKKAFLCPGSQSDVSVFRNLLFVSGEALDGRTDCGTQGVADTVDHHRLRGIRIFDITDIANPKPITNVQTCRGSHTHMVVRDPDDTANVYIYVSGAAPVRSSSELAGCSGAVPEKDPNSALFRIEVIRVPLAAPQRAAIVSSPRIFGGLAKPPSHGETAHDVAEAAAEARAARARGAFTATIDGMEVVIPDEYIDQMLAAIVQQRGGRGAPTRADSAALRQALPGIVARMTEDPPELANRGPTQCHDITVYPAIGLAGGACGGYGLLLDISDPEHPRRVAAVADTNFSYWHSATFNNDGTKILFTDEWGGGMSPRCRATDKPEWGANAIFTLTDTTMTFRSYYKLPAPQTKEENCVAHNGSLIPVPGRDIMVQAWYQGGVSVFDWTDAARPVEIAFHDRGPVDSTKMIGAGSWSSYWYNGYIYSSEIARGLDVFELTPSSQLSQNEIDAAKLVHVTELNAQNQQRMVWPASFVVARAYVDQLERSAGLPAERIAALRAGLTRAEGLAGAERRAALTDLASGLTTAASSDQRRVRLLSGVLADLSK